MQDILSAIKQYLDDGKGFEVVFEGDNPFLRDVKGVSKIEISKGEMRGLPLRKAGKKKIPEDQKAVVMSASKILLDNKIPFKVTIASKEATIRFDLDRYIHMYPDKCVIVGFKNFEEKPLPLIKDCLSNCPNLKLLSPKR